MFGDARADQRGRRQDLRRSVLALATGIRGQRAGALPVHGGRFLGAAPRRPRAAFQHVAQLGHALRPVVGARAQHPVDGVQKALAAAGQLVNRQARRIVMHGTRRGRRRRAAQQQVVHRGTQRVEVGPRTLAHRAGFAILFDGRIGRLEDGRECLALVAEHAPRGAKVQQHGAAVGFDLDVVRRDVAVVDTFAVQPLDGTQQRHQYAAQPSLVRRPHHVQADVLHGAAAHHRHGHVSGAVGLPEAQDLQQRRVVEAGQQLGLVDKGPQAEPKTLGVGLRAQRDTHGLGAAGQGGRHVLLDRDFAFKGMIEGQIDNAKTAHPQQAEQLELAQPRAGLQSVRVVVSEARCIRHVSTSLPGKPRVKPPLLTALCALVGALLCRVHSHAFDLRGQRGLKPAR